MNMQQKKSEKQLANEKSKKIMNGVAYWQCGLRFIEKIHIDLSKII